MNSFYISVSNGLLKDGHRKKMGSSVWQFMWILDKITKIDDDGIGWVLGGKPIKLEEMSLGLHKNIVSVNISKLEKSGYIKTRRTPYGMVISVMKAKKIFNKKENHCKQGITKNSESLKTVERITENSDYKEDNTKIRQRNTPASPQGSLKANKKTMKKNSFNYQENASSDSYEDVVDLDTGEKARTKDGNVMKGMKELLSWAESRRGSKFINVGKQFKAMKTMRLAGVSMSKVKNRWDDMEKDSYWSKRGFDFADVANNLDKK